MRRNSRKIIIVLMILLISIGFAFLSSNLSIIGNTLISKQSWDIHFENPTKVGGNMTATTLDLTNSTTVNFTVDLLQPRDYYEFTVDVVNDGSIDGMISSISGTELTASQKKLFEYVITYDDGAALKEKQLLAHNTSDKYKVTVRYKDDINSTDLSTTNTTVDIEIHVEYVQADNTAINRIKNSFISLYNQSTLGVLAQGDEVNIGNEHFYIISEDTNKYVLLSKYNLNVGDYKNPNVLEGVQDKSILGWNTFTSARYGTVAFSKENYWNIDNFDDYYTTEQYSYNILDKNKKASSGKNYSIAYYLDNYDIYLTNTLESTLLDVRLLTYEEARNDMHCDSSWCNYESYPWFKRTTFWLSSVTGKNVAVVMRVNFAGDLVASWYGQYNYCGVRPVIEVSKQYL